MSTTATARADKLATVVIPVDDVDGAIAFYTEKLGFEKRIDVPFGGQYRWVEVAPGRRRHDDRASRRRRRAAGRQARDRHRPAHRRHRRVPRAAARRRRRRRRRGQPHGRPGAAAVLAARPRGQRPDGDRLTDAAGSASGPAARAGPGPQRRGATARSAPNLSRSRR